MIRGDKARIERTKTYHESGEMALYRVCSLIAMDSACDEADDAADDCPLLQVRYTILTSRITYARRNCGR